MGNGKLFLNTMNYLAAQENLIGIQPRTFDLPRVNLTNRQMKGTFILVADFDSGIAGSDRHRGVVETAVSGPACGLGCLQSGACCCCSSL